MVRPCEAGEQQIPGREGDLRLGFVNSGNIFGATFARGRAS
jgi:hypothetical protein